MSMGHKQPPAPVAETLPQGQGQPFYQTLEEFLTQHDFDGFVEKRCRKFYATKMGRPSLPPGVYFRALLMGYFEGLGAERAIAWRIQDSLSLRAWLGIAPSERAPVHSTLSRTRRRLSVKAHWDVFRFVLARLGEEGLVCGRTVGIDASTIAANAALKALMRREGGQNYQQFLDELLRAAGVADPTPEDRRRLDKQRKKKGSNKEWMNPYDPDARILKLKDGRTHLGYRNEQTVDLDTGAVVGVVVHLGDRGDPQSLEPTQAEAQDNLVSIREGEAAQDQSSHLEEVVTDKGYHSNQTLQQCEAQGLRTYFSEPQRRKRTWKGDRATQRAAYRNRRRIRGKRGKALLRRRGEFLERPFHHRLDLGGMRRAHVQGQKNLQKREYITASAQNLGLLMRHHYGMGTPRSLQDSRAAVSVAHSAQPQNREARSPLQHAPRRQAA